MEEELRDLQIRKYNGDDGYKTWQRVIIKEVQVQKAKQELTF